MIPYYRTMILASALLAVLLVVNNVIHPVPWWIWGLLLLSYTGVMAWGATNIQAGFYIKAICSEPAAGKVVALTFDDGPQQSFTPQVLDVLQAHKAPAAFFCIGEHIEKHGDLLQRIHAEGHIIGNHSYSHHFWFDLFGAGRMLQELQRTDALVKKLTGSSPRFFRPPYGVTNPSLRRAILRGGYIPIGWNIRSLDTIAKEEEALLHRITSQLQPGSIILLHDSVEITLKILPALIGRIRQEGYAIERIDKMLNIPAYV